MDLMAIAPKLVRLVVGVLCAAVGLSALGLGLGAAFAGPKVVWVLLGFEVVTLAAGVIGVLFALGRFREAPGLALACVAGTFFVAAVLGYVGSGRQLPLAEGGIALKGMLLARLAAAMVVGGGGGGLVLARDRRSWGYLIKSAALGGPVLLALGVYAASPVRVRGALDSLPGWLVAVGLIVGGLLGIVMVSASVHLLVRAFELGKLEEGSQQTRA
jgi:hypothetical protein